MAHESIDDERPDEVPLEQTQCPICKRFIDDDYYHQHYINCADMNAVEEHEEW